MPDNIYLGRFLKGDFPRRGDFFFFQSLSFYDKVNYNSIQFKKGRDYEEL
jgi:hypothetical protein